MKYVGFLLVIFSIMYSCNPVNRVIKDPVKMNRMAEEVVRRGYCSNDTTIITQVTDTFFIYHEDQIDTMQILDDMCMFDTVLRSGTRISYANGFLMINEKIRVKNKVITKTIDNYVRDTKMEQLLKKDIEYYKDSVMVLQSRIFSLESFNENIQNKLNKTQWYLMIVIGVVVISWLFKMFKSVTKPF